MPASAVANSAVAAARTPPQTLADELGAQLHISTALCAANARAAIATAVADGDRHAEMVAGHYLAAALRLCGEDDEALDWCDRVDAAALELGEALWHARSMQCRALVHHGAGDDETAIEVLSAAVEACRAARDDAAIAESLTLLGHTFAEIPGFAVRAATTLATARRLWRACGDSDGAAAAQVGLAITYLATSREIATSNRAGALAAARSAVAAAQIAVREADDAGIAELSVDARLTAVEALQVADASPAELGRALDSAESILRRFPSPGQQVVMHRLRAGHEFTHGDRRAAVAEARRGLELCATISRPREREHLLGLLSEMLEAEGDLTGAVQVLRELNDSLRVRSRLTAERRSTVLAAKLDTEQAQRTAERERERAAALERRNTELTWAAEHDPLTGLANRRALDAALAGIEASPDAPVSLCLVDVDFFKRVNDTCSHQVGDRVLVKLAQALRTAVRNEDLAARYGGEEFALVLPGADAAVAGAVAERLRRFVESLMWPFELPDGRITVSVGVTTATHPVSPADLLARADAALYEAKRGGRNIVVAG